MADGTPDARDAPAEMRVSRDDLPWLARAASTAAREGQRWYLRYVGLDLQLLIIVALVSAVTWPDPTARTIAALIAAGLLVVSLVLTGLTQQERHGRSWLDGRAVAESVKTHAWRYMTRADPYQGDAASDAIDEAFERDLNEILHNRAGFAGQIGGHDEATDIITPVMRRVRALDPGQRVAVYVRDRLAGQQTYYREGAARNYRQQRRWTFIVIGAQAVGAFAALAKAVWTDLPIDLAGVFATVAASALAWLQVRQFQELSHAYGLAAQELALVRSRADRVRTNADAAAFVADAETYMSREHGQWIARRDRP